jgi:hypothetical protein
VASLSSIERIGPFDARVSGGDSRDGWMKETGAMNNPWKIATLGLVAVSVTALSTGVTTAYLLRPSTQSSTESVEGAPRASVARVAPAPRQASAVARPAVVTPAVATRPAVVTPVSAPVDPVAAECTTGGGRAMKIAKPGLIGTLAGAGLGAIGGAVVDGGAGAGKGALIGGLAGAALGGGYGAYKTKQECGTIFGGAAGFAGGAPAAAFSTDAAPGQGITVYNAR